MIETIEPTLTLDRLPPQNPEAEEAVIACLMVDREAVPVVRAMLEPGDCYRDRNRHILAAIYALDSRGEPADLVTISDELKRRELYEQVGGFGYLSKLSMGGLTLSLGYHVEHYAGIVRRCAFKRRLISAAGRIARIGYADELSEDEARGQAWAELSQLEAVAAGDELLPEHQAQEVNEMVTELALRGTTGLHSGLIDLDGMTHGFQPGQLVVVLGVTGMGKSAWAQSVARNMGQAGTPGLYCSVEMGKRQLLARNVAAVLGRSWKEIEWQTASNRMPPEVQRALDEAKDRLEDYRMILWYKANMTTADVRQKAAQRKASHAIRYLVVDHIQIMMTKNAENRNVAVGEVCRELKRIAGELGLVVIALSQMNREFHARSDKRPTLTDAKESGSIEQDADIVLGLYRDDFYYQVGGLNERKQPVEAGKAELLVLKHRDGPTGSCDMSWRAATAEYVNYAPEERG